LIPAAIRRRAFGLARGLAAGPALAVLLVDAAVVGVRTSRRRRAGSRPRLVYGPTPIISIKYMSEAMRRRGYETLTLVYGIAAINQRSDYDVTFAELLGSGGGRVRVNARELLGPYLAFHGALTRGDVFHFFFDGGFLRFTPLRFLELQLLHLAGKRVVVMPYGGDVALPSRTRSAAFREAFMAEYPEVAAREAETARWISYFSRHADFTVGCLVHVETMPRCDLLATHYYPIDVEEWSHGEVHGGRDEVVVFHSSNHRAVKGTRFVVEACDELAAEGVRIRLDLAEGVPNVEVRSRLASADVLAEQFVLGYALSAMEGMSLGKPVLSNLEDDAYYGVFRERTGLDECPLVSTTPDMLKPALHRLATDPALRAELGAAGRAYVLKFHSFEPVGRMWELVYRTVWHGEPLERTAWHPGREPATAGPADIGTGQAVAQ